MFRFRNIDTFIPGKFEKMGMLKGKRWYINIEDKKNGQESPNVLFKPQRNEFADKKVFCANHYGELVGYLLAKGAQVPSCRAELARLSRYYENIHKERNRGTPEKKDGCIMYSELEKNQILDHGSTIIDMFALEDSIGFTKLSRGERENDSNNIQICLAAIENTTRRFYERKKVHSPEYIQKKVNENRYQAINMIVYDCLYGNNDRHDENWAMVKDFNGTDIALYPLYDNERVLGLYENIRFIRNALETRSIEKTSESKLFSRMITPHEKNKNSSYKSVLQYLMSKYGNETTEILKQHLSENTPQKIQMYLQSCEGLPEEYVEFGTKMYEFRYNFAKNLIRKKEEQQAVQEQY